MLRIIDPESLAIMRGKFGYMPGDVDARISSRGSERVLPLIFYREGRLPPPIISSCVGGTCFNSCFFLRYA